MRVLLAEAAVEAELDPDRLSFSEGLFELTEMLSLALTVESEEAPMRLLRALAAQDGTPCLASASVAHQSPGDQADLSQVQTEEAWGAST